MLALSLLIAFSGTAEARSYHRSHHGPVVVAPRGHVHFTIGVGPWSPRYVPAPRSGYRWVAGLYVRGRWSPGYWVPIAAAPTPGGIWVHGHWEGDHYVEGYWSHPDRSGETWVEGHYDEDGNWIEGRWVDARDAGSYSEGPSAPPTERYAPPEESDERGPAAIPFDVEEEDLDEVHAPPPER
jgi:hypothetical protein